MIKRHFRLRKPSFSPLNYGDKSISDFRSRTADFKPRTLALALCEKARLVCEASSALLAQNFSKRYPVRFVKISADGARNGFLWLDGFRISHLSVPADIFAAVALDDNLRHEVLKTRV